MNRQANQTTCDVSGDCSGATFAAVTQAQKVEYAALIPTVCVIPSHLLGGIF